MLQVQFEDRQRELEERLLKYERPGDKNLKEGVHPHTHVGALEKELDSVKERYKKRLVESENEADRLRKEISVLRGKEMGKESFLQSSQSLLFFNYLQASPNILCICSEQPKRSKIFKRYGS